LGKIVKKQEIIDLLSEKTNFYKKNMKNVVEAFSEIIFETLESATFEQDSEIHLMHGLVISGHRVPERESKDPRTGEKILSPEKVIPKATFKSSLRLKLYKKPKGYKKKAKKV
jgi:nucleoid DNA-binding protein